MKYFLYTIIFTIGAAVAAAQPVNDNPCGAIAITPTSSCSYTACTSVGATATAGVPAPGCASYSTGDVWYSVVVPANGQITADLQAGTITDSGLALYTATGSCPSLTLALLSCDDDGGTGNMSQLTATCLTPGSTVYLRVWDFSDGTGTFGLCVTSPPSVANDNPCNAIPLTVTSACNYISTSNTNASPHCTLAAPSCGVGTLYDIWYSAVVPANGILVFDSSPGTLTNTGVAFYTGSCSGTLTAVACNDNGSHTGASMSYLYQTGLTPGSTVYIRIWGQSGTTGTFGFCVSTPPTNTSSTPASDFCYTATPICDFNGYYGNTSSSYTTAGPKPNEVGTPPVQFCGGIQNNSWLGFTASGTTASFNVFVTNCTTGTGIQMAMYSTNCTSTTGSFTLVSNCVNPSSGSGNPNGFVITANSLTPGNQYVMMIDGYGGDVCNYTIGANAGVDVISIASSVPSKIICPSGSGTTLTVDAVGTGPFTYNWGVNPTLSATNTANPVATPSVTTTYTVTVTGGNCGASQTASITITVANPTLSTSLTPATCGNSDGSASVTASAISGISYSYLWNAAAQTTTTASNLAQSTYTVTVTSTGGCTKTASVTVTGTTPPTASISGSNLFCAGGNTTVTASGGGTYLWTDGATTANTTISTIGTYTVTVTAANTCTATASINIGSNPLPAPTLSAGTITCSSTTAALNASGGTPYFWSANATAVSGASATATAAGNYTVTVTHANGCTASTTIAVTQNTSAPATALSANGTVTCSNTSVDLTASGGTSYTWSGNVASSAGASATATTGATYTVTATNSANGCTASSTIAVLQNTSAPSPTISTAPNILTCSVLNTNITASGGTSYSWSTGGTGNIVSGVAAATVNVDAAATYTVVATNSVNGCTASTTVAVTQNILPPTPSIAVPSVLTCSVLNTTLTASGGLSYSWSSNVVSSSGASASANMPATYIVTATAANGCTASTTVAVTQDIATPAASANNSGNPCPTTTLSLSASGGASYAWAGPSAYSSAAQNPTVSNSATAAMMGTYTVTVTGANGCTSTATTAVSLLAAPTTNTPTKTCNVAGTFYTYRFNIAGTPTPTITDNAGIGGIISGGAFISNNIPVGSFPTFTVANSCGSLTMIPPNTPCATTFDCSGTTGCFGPNLVQNPAFESGNVSFNPAGPAYAVAYNGACIPGSNTCSSNVSNAYYSGTTNDIMCQGRYGVDANVRQCNKFWSPNITDHTSGAGKMMMIDFPSGYNAATNKLWCEYVTLQGNTDYCFGGYFINLVPAANSAYADPSFGFSLDGVLFTNTATISEDEQWHSNGVQFHNNTTGSYLLCINNLNAGTTGFDVAIDDISVKTINTGTIPSTTNDVKILCSGASSVTIPVLANDTPGAGSLDYTTLKITTTPAFTDGYISSINTTTGTVTFTPYATFNGSANFEYQICNTTGCCATALVTVTSGSNPTASITATGGNAVCQNSTKTISLSSVTGGSGSGYTYNWSNSTTATSTSVAPTVSPSTYTVTVTDGAGCSVTSTIALTINPLPTANAGAAATICNGTSSALTASATGGSGSAYSYNWNDAGANPHNVNPNTNTTYSVTVTDGNGCTNTSTTQILVNQLPTASIANVSAICRNTNATLTASATGGSGVYTAYAWDNALGAGAVKGVSPISTTIYNVTVTDSNGCTDSENMTVTINQLPSVDAGINRAICAGGSTTLSASSSGGSGGSYSYNWSAGLGTGANKTVSPSTTTTYTVTVTDGNGCTSSTTVMITVNAVTAATMSNNSPQFCAGKTTTITINGTGTFLWNTGATTQTITVNTVGTFTATVTDGNGCISTASATTTQNSLPTPVVAPLSSSFCTGNSANINVAPFNNYTWSNGQTSQSLSVTTGGIYTVTVTDANGCTATASRNVLQNPLPNFSITGTPAFCQGANTTFSVTGTTGSYAWSNAANTVSTVVNSAGNYTVTVTDGNGCSSTESITAIVNPLPNPSITGNSSFCFGGNSLLDAGAFTTYQWSNSGGIIGSATIQTYSATQPGIYTVQVTNINGCTATDSKTITQNANIIPNISGTTSICAGASTDIDAGSYNNYVWSTGVTGQAIITVTTAGNYTVTVTDIAGCTGTNSVTITTNTNPVVSIGGNTAFCTGTNTALTANVVSSFMGINSGYEWSNGFSGHTVNSVTITTPNTYIVTVTDDNGCSATSTVTITENPLPVPAISGATAFCQASSTTLTASGGVGTYNYLWSSGATNDAITVTTTPPVSYTVTVTNPLTTCSATTSASITINPRPAPAITTTTGTSSFCAGSTVGLGLNSTTGLTAYQWGNSSGAIASATTPTYTTTIAGIYTVTVSNSFGCTGTASMNITQNANPTPSINAGAASAAFCAGSNVLLTATGGNTYLWSTGATTASINANSITTYTVTVTNTATTCTASHAIPVIQNALPTPTITGVFAYCAGNNTTITAGGAGSGAGAGYVWNTAETTAGITISGTPLSVYTVTVTDSNGCTATSTTNITVNANPVATISDNGSPIAAAFCVSKNITLTAPVGMTSYAWANTGGVIAGANNNSYLVNTAGTYTVTISNSNGCTASSNLVVTQSNSPSASITTTGNAVAVCAGNSIGLSANTGVGLSYSWSTGASSQNITVTPLNTGDYTVTVTNLQGCTDVAIQNIVQNTLPTASISGTPSYCSNSSTVLTAGGGTTYAWSNGSTNAASTINSSVVGTSTYTVTVTSAQNCSTVSTVAVTVNPTPIATITTAGNATAFCAGTSLALNAPSGMTTYSWSDGTSGQGIAPTNGGQYSVVVTNGSGCASTATITLTQNPLPPASIATAGGATAVCPGNSIGLTANTGAGLSYSWSTGATSQNIIVTPLNTSDYTVTVTNAQGCTSVAIQNIVKNISPTASMTGIPSYCSNSSTVLTAGGGTTYAWSNGSTNAASTINSSVVGTSTYTVTVTSAQNCSTVSTVAVVVNPTPIATITTAGNATAFCIGTSLTLTAPTGMTTYAWSDGTSGQSISPTNGGQYSVVVTNGSSCASTATITLTQNPLPPASIATAGGATAVCPGNSIGLTANTGAGLSYSWSTGATSQNITVTPLNTSDYTVTVTNAQGCTNTAVQNIVQQLSPTASMTGIPSYCSNSSTVLTAGGGNSYAWSNGSTNAASTINSSVVGTSTYTVTVTSAQNCSTISTVAVTVNPTPIATITTAGNATAFCAGTSLALNAPSGMTTYSWSDGTSGQGIAPTNGGQYSVVVTNGSGCASTASITLTQNPLPPASITTTSGATAVCAGSSITLNANASSGTAYTYLWNTGATTISNTQIPSATTTYTVTVTIPATACTATATQTIVYNARPVAAITGTISYCTGSSTTLTASGGGTYAWSTGASTAAATINNATVGTSNYTVTVTTTATGCTGTSAASITVNARPAVTISGANSFCTGSNFTLNAPVGLVNYQWSKGGVALTGATGNTYTANTAGSYSVVAANAQGCTATASITITANSLPIVDINAGATNAAFCQGSAGTALTLAGGLSGTWTGGLSGNSITVTTAGTYIATVTNAQGCTATDAISVVENALPTPTISGAATTCGATSTTLDAGTGYASYNWATSSTFATSLGTAQTLPVSTTNTYYVRVTDANTCSNTASYTVTQFSNPSPTIISSNSNTICNAGTTTLTANSGYIFYRWSSGQSGANANVVTATTAGIYTVTVTAAGGCTGTQDFVLNLAALPEPNIIGNAAFCTGSSTNLTANGGITGTFTYTWSNGSTTQIVNIAASGTYTVTVTSAANCTASTNVFVSENQNPQAAIAGNASYCANTGSTTLNASGGFFGTFNYLWSTGETIDNITINTQPSANTIYTVTVTNSGTNCVASSTFAVTEFAQPSTNIIATSNSSNPNSFCAGSSATLTAVSGFSSYQWYNGSTAIGITNIQNVSVAGVYSVVITNTNGCTNSATINIAINALPTPTINSATANNVASVAFCQNTTVTVTATGGGTYTWSNSTTTAANTISNAGIYTVVVTDGNNCQSTASVTVTQNALPTIAIAGTPTYCSGNNTILTANGGTGYSWQNGSSTAVSNNANLTVSGIPNNPYTVTVTDANGCQSTAAVSVTAFALPTTTITTSTSNTNFCANSTITLNAGGGFTNYQWSNSGGTISGATNSTYTTNVADTYTVVITNNNNCSSSTAISVTTLPTPTTAINGLSVGATAAFCIGSNAALTASGGVSYLWTGGANTATINATSAGTYTVIATNAQGCTGTASIAVTQNTLPNPVISGTPSYCTGASTTLTASGGTAYNWGAGFTATPTFTTSANSSATYSVTVQNANGCTASTSIAITVNTNPTAVITTSNNNPAFCAGSTISLDANSGLAPYTWSNASGIISGANSNNYIVGTAGVYTVQVTNNSGCTGTTSITVIQNSLPNPTITGVNSFCTNSSTNLTATGGITYIWNNGTPSANITITQGGSYQVTTTDANGCTASTAVSVTQFTLPQPAIVGNSVTCSGSTTILSLATAYSQYHWSTNENTATINATGPQTYTVTVTDANNCSNTASIGIGQNASPIPTLSTTSNQNILCAGGTITISTGNNFVVPYTWTNSSGIIAGQTSSSLTTNAAGIYTVQVTNAQGCTGTASILVTLAQPPTAASVLTSSNTNGSFAFCANSSVVISATGATGANYIWDNALNTQSITVNTASTHTVTVTDTNGCTASASVTVQQNSLPNTAITGTTFFCFGGSTTLTASGATNLIWNTGATSPTLVVSTQGTYTVTATNPATNCSATMSATVARVNLPTTAITGNTDFCTGTSTTVAAGLGFASYQWSDATGAIAGETNNNYTATTAGTYTVLFTNVQGCASTQSISIVQNSLPQGLAINGNSAFCAGGNTTLTASTTSSLGTGGFVWSTSTSGITTVVNQATIYTVTATDANGCTATTTLAVTQNALPTPSIATTTATTCTNSTTTLSLATPASGSYTAYLWSYQNATTPTVSVSATGDYYVVVTDNHGCTNTASTHITQNIAPTPSIVTTPTGTVVCTGSTLNLAANTGYQAYLWSTGATTYSINVTTGGVYTVVVTTADGCTGSVALTVTAQNPPTLAAAISGNLAFCQGENTNLTAGTATSYLWSNGQTSQTINVVSPNTYTVVVRDAFGCSASSSVTVLENQRPLVVITGDNSYCTNSSATITASFTPAGNGVFGWNTGATTSAITVSGVPQNPYVVTVTDANGCTASQATTLARYNAPITTISSNNTNNVICGANGSITLDGGAGFSSYHWSDNSIGRTVVATTTGVWTVTVTNGQGCTTSATITLSSAANPVAAITTISGVPQFCAGGTVGLIASGGGTYQWTGGNTQSNLIVGITGLYSVVVTNAQGCTASSTVQVTQAANPTPNIQGVSSLCSGSATTLDAGANYASYQWALGGAPIGNAQTITVSNQGSYYVTVTNAAGCAGLASVNVQVFQSPTIGINASATSFCSGSSVTLTATNGMSSYLWNVPGATTDRLVITRGGTYTVQASNGNLCTAIASITIDENALPTVTITGPNEFCAGSGSNLAASVNPPFGTSNGSYAWTGGGGNTPVKNVTAGGTYTVTVTDARGCRNTASYAVVQHSLPTADAGQDIEAYPAEPFTLNAQGGLTYQWNNNPSFTTSNTIPNPSGTILQTTTFTVTVTDVNGCTDSDQVIVKLGEVLKCLGESEGVTPNGDGHNDTWTIGCLAYFDNEVQVYNRWGQLLFSQVNYDSKWDCTLNGSPIPDGTYYYIIIIKTSDPTRPTTYKGNLTIIR